VAASPAAFGKITILMTVVFAVLQCLRGLVGIPLLQTSNQSEQRIRSEASLALATALGVSPLLVLAVLIGYPFVGLPAVAIALSAPFLLGQDVLRHMALAIARPNVAAVWDGVWCLGAVLTLVLAWLRLPIITATTVLAAWGILGLVAFVAMAIQLRIVPRSSGIIAWFRRNWQDRLSYGVDAGLEQTGLVIVFLVTSAAIGADAAGALRGAMALFAPIGIFGVAVQMVLISESVRSSASPRVVWRMLFPTALLTAFATAVLGVIAYLLPSNLGFYLLGESFEGAQRAMIPTTAWFVAACFAVVVGIQLKTFNRSRELITMKLSAWVVQLLVAAGAAVWIGTPGGIAACLATETALAALFFYLLWPPTKLVPRLDEPSAHALIVEEPLTQADLPMVLGRSDDAPDHPVDPPGDSAINDRRGRHTP
jgi:hypothetical protein